jgi:hypothetical protein
MLGPPLARSTTGVLELGGIVERRMPRVHEREDAQVDALEAGGRTLKVTVVDGQHHRPPGVRSEDPGEPVAHAPVERPRSFEEETLAWRRHICVKVLGFTVRFGHPSFLPSPLWPLASDGGIILQPQHDRGAILWLAGDQCQGTA